MQCVRPLVRLHVSDARLKIFEFVQSLVRLNVLQALLRHRLHLGRGSWQTLITPSLLRACRVWTVCV